MYQPGQKVEIRGVVQHLDISHGEGSHNNTKATLHLIHIGKCPDF